MSDFVSPGHPGLLQLSEFRRSDACFPYEQGFLMASPRDRFAGFFPGKRGQSASRAYFAVFDGIALDPGVFTAFLTSCPAF